MYSEAKRSSHSIAGYVILAIASMLAVWAFVPELAAGPNQFSDVSLHLAILQQMHDSVTSGGSAFDFWFDGSPFGYPLVRIYQSLPHLVMYLVYRLCQGAISFPTILTSFTLLFAALVPWSFYFCARTLGWPPLYGALAGFLSLLVSEVGGYGLGMQNYSWGTHGIITQLWGLVFVVPAIALGVAYIREARYLALTLALVLIACGSHLLSAHLFGFSVTLAAAILWLLGERRNLLTRLVVLGAGCALVISYQLITMLPDAALVHKSVLEPQWKFASHGIDWVVTNLFSGALFDDKRAPILSFAVLAGALLLVYDLMVSRDRENRLRAVFLIASFVLWLSLLCGYELWGAIFSNLPFFRSMHMHRFIVGVHIFGVLIAARFLYEIFRQIPSVVVSGLVVGTFLLPVFEERRALFDVRHDWASQAQLSPETEAEIQDLIAYLHASPRGMVYAGMARDWANELRLEGSAPLYHRLLIAGFPSLSILFHPFGLAGDAMFDFDPTRKDRYDLFGVRYVVAPLSWQPPDFLRHVKAYRSYKLLEYEAGSVAALRHIAFEGWGDPQAAARFMQRWISSGIAANGVFGRLVEKPTGSIFGVDFHSIDISSLFSMPKAEVLGTITSTEWKQQSIRVDVSLREEAMLMLKVGYHPSWRVLINDVQAETFPVTPGFLGVRVSTGDSTIVARYHPSRQKAVLFFLCLLIPLAVWRLSSRCRLG